MGQALTRTLQETKSESEGMTIHCGGGRGWGGMRDGSGVRM